MDDNSNDLERKIKRIIYNYQRSYGRYPNYEELSRYTGRDKDNLQKILKKMGYLRS